MQQGVKDVNTLLSSIADLNLAISESPGLAQRRMPNELLDQRDEKLRQLSELVNIRVTDTEGSQVNVSLSNGLSLVIGNNAAKLDTQRSAEDPSRLEFNLTNGGRTLNIDEQITGGKLGGLRRFDNEALKPAFDELGRIAIGLAASVNHQHEIGMDLEGDLGGLFFNDINDLAVQRSRVVANANNQLPKDGRLAVEITDSTKLLAGSWTLQFSGDGSSFELIDKATGKVVNQGRLPNPVQSEISMPGFNIRIEGGTFNAGDKYLIQPSRNAAQSMGLQVNREEDLAFASPIRATTGEQNVGTGKIDQGTMLDVRSPFTGSLLPGFQTAGELANGPLTIMFEAGGSTGIRYVVKGPEAVPGDPSSAPTIGSPREYTGGNINLVFGKIDQGTMLDVRSPFTGSLLPGFQTAGELANGPLTIMFEAGGSTGIRYVVKGPEAVPGDPSSAPTIGSPREYTGGNINLVFSSDPAAGADYQGFQFKLTGQPAVGDTFEINYNSNGVSDNRNAELLAALGTANTLNGKSQSFTEGYAGLVEDIGVKTRQSQFDLSAGKTLLEQSTAQRESVSGVNLDEEAGRLIQYQAAYNASAQVISVAQDLFNTLLQTFR